MDERRVLVWKASWLAGSETFVRNQIDSLGRYQPTAVGLKKVASPIDSDTDVILYRNSLKGRLGRKFFFLFLSNRQFNRLLDRVDLMHAHFVTDAALGVRAAKARGVPVVVTAHGHDVTALRTHRAKRKAKRTLNSATHVIAVSQFIASRLRELGVHPSRISVIPIGVPIRDSVAVAEKTWDIAFVGRLVEKKGVGDLLTALESMRGRDCRVSAVVAGDGPMREQLERQAQDASLDVTFLGALTPDGVRGLLASSRIFVAPSKTSSTGDAEGFGMVFLEAALAGIPCVAYRHGGVTEAVQDGVTGMLVDEGDVEALARVIRQLIMDEDRQKILGVNARNRAIKHFDIVDCVAKLELLYDKVVQEFTSARRS